MSDQCPYQFDLMNPQLGIEARSPAGSPENKREAYRVITRRDLGAA